MTVFSFTVMQSAILEKSIKINSVRHREAMSLERKNRKLSALQDAFLKLSIARLKVLNLQRETKTSTEH